MPLNLEARLRKLETYRPTADPVLARPDRTWYQERPVDYCRDVLKVRLTPVQEKIARLVCRPPYRVLVKSAHTVGKSFLAACLVNWWFDCFWPGIVLTSAPSAEQVKNILWKEVRRIRFDAGLDTDCFLPKACRMETSVDHFAFGFTARDRTGFQGHHEVAVLIIFDEAEGIDLEFWDAAQTMLQGDRYGFLAIYNPYLSSGPAVDAERSGNYHVETMSALDHPNISAELRGQRPEYPAAVRLQWVRDAIAEWCDPADPGQPGAFQFDGKWYVAQGKGEAAILGRRPTAGINAVFPEYLFDLAVERKLPWPNNGRLQIGVDVAWEGNDDTALHVQKGGVSLHHESFHGQNPTRTAERAMSLALTLGAELGFVDPRKSVVIAVDTIGIGAGVFSNILEAGWRRAVGVNSWEALTERTDHPDLRSALWFGFADACRRGNISLGGLSKKALNDLRTELTAPVYWLDVRGRRKVEPKLDTKERIGRSPDNADALLLAYANVGGQEERVAGRVEVP
jgi:hypothetical protein